MYVKTNIQNTVTNKYNPIDYVYVIVPNFLQVNERISHNTLLTVQRYWHTSLLSGSILLLVRSLMGKIFSNFSTL